MQFGVGLPVTRSSGYGYDVAVALDGANGSRFDVPVEQVFSVKAAWREGTPPAISLGDRLAPLTPFAHALESVAPATVQLSFGYQGIYPATAQLPDEALLAAAARSLLGQEYDGDLPDGLDPRGFSPLSDNLPRCHVVVQGPEHQVPPAVTVVDGDLSSISSWRQLSVACSDYLDVDLVDLVEPAVHMCEPDWVLPSPSGGLAFLFEERSEGRIRSHLLAEALTSRKIPGSRMQTLTHHARREAE